MWIARASLLLTCLAAASAAAVTLDVVRVGDLPGSDGRWQVGEVTVAAPPERVQSWLSDATRWSARFPDDKWARDLGRAPDGRRVAQMSSRLLGRTMTLYLDERPGLIVYAGSGKGVTTQGKVFIEPVAAGGTRVIMQTSGELHGATGALVSESMKRKRALKKLSADLNAIVQLARSGG
jgi:carbon monoxide dehydrogenase subunit G